MIHSVVQTTDLSQLFVGDSESASTFSQEDYEQIFAILSFWFGSDELLKKNSKKGFTDYDDLWRKKWFAKGEAQKKLDVTMKQEFEGVIISALQGQKDHWQSTPYPICCTFVYCCYSMMFDRFRYGCLALIILLDQYTRNISFLSCYSILFL